jgi:hypothetical protein
MEGVGSNDYVAAHRGAKSARGIFYLWQFRHA